MQQRRQHTNSTPPTLIATKSNNSSKNYTPDLNSGVSPSIAALRNSIYQAERNRMGITNDDNKELNYYSNGNSLVHYNRHESDNTDNEDYADDVDGDVELSGSEFDHLKYLVQVT